MASVHKCLKCTGHVNSLGVVGGYWLVHTIKRRTEQHWTASDVGRVRTACRQWVWLELQVD